MYYKGDIIEESLQDKSILDDVKIINTRVEKVIERHRTPWLKKWTLHFVEVPEEKAESFSKRVQKALETKHAAWYVDYKNETWHYIIFPDKIFKIDRKDPKGNAEARAHGISLGIPEYQVDFSPEVA